MKRNSILGVLLMLLALAFTTQIGYSTPISIDNDVGISVSADNGLDMVIDITQEINLIPAYDLCSQWKFPAVEAETYEVGQLQVDLYVNLIPNLEALCPNTMDFGQSYNQAAIEMHRSKSYTDREGLFRLDIGESVSNVFLT